MKNIVILTAKGGNTTIQNKNIVPVLGLPVFLYPLRAAKMALRTDAIFVSTEDATIKSLALKEGVSVIDRPPELSRPESDIRDVIHHAVKELSGRIPSAENFIVLLGNTVMVTPGLIDKSFQLLEGEGCDSVATVWKAQDDHPYRALKLNEEGFAESFLNHPVGSNRQSYPPVYFYDQGIWGFKKSCGLELQGPAPWVWLGRRCKLIERLWVTGRDIHTWIDVAASVWYLTGIQPNDVSDYREIGAP